LGTGTGSTGTYTVSASQTTASTTITVLGVDFYNIPSWAKRITIIYNGFSLSGTSSPLIQIGSGSIDTTSTYTGLATINSASTANTTGFLLTRTSAAADLYYGQAVLTLISGNIWVIAGQSAQTSSALMSNYAGSKSLSGALDRVRITAANGTDNPDAGTINIQYE
jgi:hypothetical protein